MVKTDNYQTFFKFSENIHRNILDDILLEEIITVIFRLT